MEICIINSSNNICNNEFKRSKYKHYCLLKKGHLKSHECKHGFIWQNGKAHNMKICIENDCKCECKFCQNVHCE